MLAISTRPRLALSLAFISLGCSGDPSDDGAGEPPFAMPIYRIGPRVASAGSFGQDAIAGTIELPASAGVDSFADWDFHGHGLVYGPAGSPSEPREEGGRIIADISINVDTAFSAPADAREILTAISPGGIVLTSVIGASRTIAFSPESTALQALDLAGVREDPVPFEDVYYTGRRAGDDPVLDEAVPGVAAAIEERLHSAGDSGILPSGSAAPGTTVFAAVTAAVGAASPPVVDPPTCGQCLGEITYGAPGGQAAVFTAGGYPLPHFPAATERASFFFYSAATAGALYVRQRLPDGAQSAASSLFQVGDEEATPPGALTLTLDADGARACGADPGNWIVFFSSATELSIGFAAVAPTGGCAFLPAAEIPEQAALLSATQISSDRRVGRPSESVFP